MHYILKSNFARIFRFLELTLQDETLVFCTFFSSFDENFILTGHSKQCAQSRRIRSVLKIERYAQRLTHGACMGEAWGRQAPGGLKCLTRISLCAPPSHLTLPHPPKKKYKKNKIKCIGYNWKRGLMSL